MGADLNNIVRTQKLTDEHVQFLIYQILRGLKVGAGYWYLTIYPLQQRYPCPGIVILSEVFRGGYASSSSLNGIVWVQNGRNINVRPVS